jgi:hypothetical protein
MLKISSSFFDETQHETCFNGQLLSWKELGDIQGESLIIGMVSQDDRIDDLPSRLDTTSLRLEKERTSCLLFVYRDDSRRGNIRRREKREAQQM